MRFKYGSDIGLRREENQDAVRCEYFGHNVLAVVCDGMGGERAGREASQIAIDEFYQRFPTATARASTPTVSAS